MCLQRWGAHVLLLHIKQNEKEWKCKFKKPTSVCDCERAFVCDFLLSSRGAAAALSLLHWHTAYRGCVAYTAMPCVVYMLIVPIQWDWFSHVLAFKYALYTTSSNVHFIFIRFFFVRPPAFFHSEHFILMKWNPLLSCTQLTVDGYFFLVWFPHFIGIMRVHKAS